MKGVRGGGRMKRAVLALAVMLDVASCTSSGGRSIPSDAVDLGGGHSVIAVAPDNGTVWIYEKDTDHVVYRGPVHAGDRITIASAEDQVQVAGAKVDLKTEHLKRGNRYRVYFLK